MTLRKAAFRFGWAVAALGILSGVAVFAELSDRNTLALEALQRLKGPNAPTPELQQAARRLALQIVQEPEWVQLVGEFRLEGMESNLVAYAARHPDSPTAGDAIRFALRGDGGRAISEALTLESPETSSLLAAMVTASDPRVVPLIQPLVRDASRPLKSRVLALQVWVSSEGGASNLWSVVRQGLLPDDLKESARNELKNSRWPALRAAAGDLEDRGPRPRLVLPPIADLVASRGDAVRGGAVFRRKDVGCLGCHQVRGEGVDFGPKLTDIGAKLGKEALITAIVDPGAGISFGFEAWRISLKDGDELVGMIASETDQELQIKQPGGLVTTVPLPGIEGREKLPVSLMPSGLHESLTREEFVDLVEYLTTLRRIPGAAE